jgi:outer membrane protein
MTTSLGAQGVKVAILDMPKALNLSEPGEIAKQELTKKFERIKNDLDQKQKDLEGLKAELEKQSLMLSLEAKLDKEKDYERKLRSFKDLYQDYKEEMARAEYEAARPIFEDLREIAEEVRIKEGYLIVFDPSNAGVICYDRAIDITDKVIEIYNNRWSKNKKGK